MRVTVLSVLFALGAIGSPAQTVLANRIEVSIAKGDCESTPKTIFAVVKENDDVTYPLSLEGTCLWRGPTDTPVKVGETLVSFRLRGRRTRCRRATSAQTDPQDWRKSVTRFVIDSPPRTASDLKVAGKPRGTKLVYDRVVEPDPDKPEGTFPCREHGVIQDGQPVIDVMFSAEELQFRLERNGLKIPIRFALDEELQKDIRADQKTQVKTINPPTIERAVSRWRNNQPRRPEIPEDFTELVHGQLGDLKMTLEPPR
jgi:hypothetical protein